MEDCKSNQPLERREIILNFLIKLFVKTFLTLDKKRNASKALESPVKTKTKAIHLDADFHCCRIFF